MNAYRYAESGLDNVIIEGVHILAHDLLAAAGNARAHIQTFFKA